MTSRKQTAQGMWFMKRKPNSKEHKDSSRWQHRKTVTGLLIKASERIIRTSSSLFTRRVADLVSEACFTAMTGDRHERLAAMDLSMIAVTLTPSWLVRIWTVVPVWQYFFFIPVFFVFFFLIRKYKNYTSVLPNVSVQSNWAWKTSGVGLPISFSFWRFLSLLTLPARLFWNFTFN